MSDTAQQTLSLPDVGVVDRLLRDRVVSQLRALRSGAVTLRDPWGSAALGKCAGRSPSPTLRVNDARFYRAVALGGSVGAAEAYMDGAWACDDLVGLVRLLVRNRDLLDDVERGPARVAGWAFRAAHALRRNTASGARRQHAAPYELGTTHLRQLKSDDPED